jgi:hypothetical protein
MPEVVDYREREQVSVTTEPPYTEGWHDPAAHGRIVRVFERGQGHPAPPDA